VSVLVQASVSILRYQTTGYLPRL